MLAFLDAHKWTLLFYIGVFLFVYLNRKRFDIHYKFIALYRTTWGLRAMDAFAGRHREMVKLLGYVGIGVAFTAMLAMLGVLLRGLYDLFFVPDAPPALSPVLPGVAIPGGIAIPLVQGILAIFVVAVIHEFSHGVVARAHHVPVKNSGPAIIGPFFAAFVEPDEARMKRQQDVVQYSIFAAGSFSNVLLALVVALFLAAVFNPALGALHPRDGVVFQDVQDGYPAAAAGVMPATAYTELNGRPLAGVPVLLSALERSRPGDTLLLGDKEIVLSPHPDDADRAYLGVVGVQDHFSNQGALSFVVMRWIGGFLSLLFALSLGIGLANLLPLGPLDGGRMFHLASTRVRGEKKGTRTWAKVSVALLFIIILLLTPVIRETGKALFNVFS